MTEAEWLACQDPTPMLELLRGTASDRKFRLFACACCRRIWHSLADERSRSAVDVAERFADGKADEAELWQAWFGRDYAPGTPDAATVLASGRRYDRPSVLFRYGIVDMAHLDEEAERTVERICSSGLRFPAEAALAVARQAAGASAAEAHAQACLLRCVFGLLPFRPPSIDPVWLTRNGHTVRDVAEAAYDAGRFEALPVLADALMDAGCDNADILAHCRSEGPHVRGCWVVDLILGKS